MIISKKCLNAGCHKYENARKDNFSACGDCAYLIKANRINFLEKLGKRGTSLLVIAVLVLVSLIGTAMVFSDQKKDTSSTSTSGEIDNSTPKVAGEKSEAETVLRIQGSNTIGAKLMPKLVEGYLKKRGAVQIKIIEDTNPKAERVEFKLSKLDEKVYDIEINSQGSSTAFTDLESGLCDIGITSRKINEKEISDLKDSGLGDFSTLKSEIIIALDGIAVIVNKQNPINNLSVEKLSDIFSGSITNWSQLGGNDGEINIFSRDEKSGTYETFKHFVLKDKSLVSDAVKLDYSEAVSNEVSKDINSIGFTSFSYVGDTKSVAISQGLTEPALPSAFNIATEDYYLSRRLYIYCPDNISNSYATGLIDYITDEQAQYIITSNNLVSMNIEVDDSFKQISNSTFTNEKAAEKYNQIVSNSQGRLSLNFLFKSGSSELDNKSKKDLERLINFLYRSKYLNYNVLLIGYSDNIGDYNMNAALSEERAIGVKRSMINSFKALDGRVEVLGMGSEIPIASNETQQGREKNRRVEVFILEKQ